LELVLETWLFTELEKDEANDVVRLANRHILHTEAREGEAYQLICALFFVLEALGKRRSEFAPVLYRNLVTLYVRLQDIYTPDCVLREQLLTEFYMFFKQSTAPVAIFATEYFRCSPVALDLIDLQFVQKLVDLGQDRLTWKVVQMAIDKVFQSMLRPQCLTQKAHQSLFITMLRNFTVPREDMKHYSDSIA
jgi:hypothetical protein